MVCPSIFYQITRVREKLSIACKSATLENLVEIVPPISRDFTRYRDRSVGERNERGYPTYKSVNEIVSELN